jgi:hypothetical protein
VKRGCRYIGNRTRRNAKRRCLRRPEPKDIPLKGRIARERFFLEEERKRDRNLSFIKARNLVKGLKTLNNLKDKSKWIVPSTPKEHELSGLFRLRRPYVVIRYIRDRRFRRKFAYKTSRRKRITTFPPQLCCVSKAMN